MDTTFRNEKSLNGHSLDELKSGLQKYIRRSIEDKALYCARELDLFADVGQAGYRIRTNFIHRLMIIYLEDISIGNYNIWNIISDDALYLLSCQKLNVRDRTKEILCIKNIIHLLVCSEKSRIPSHLNNLASCHKYENIMSVLKNTPLYQYANIEQFNNIDQYKLTSLFKEHLDKKSLLCVLIAKQLSEKNKDDIIFECLNMKEYNIKYINIAKKWHKEIKTKEQFLTWLVPLAYYLFINDNEFINDYEIINANIDLKSSIWTSADKIPILKFDEYVMDKHTKLGHNKTTKYFAEVSSVVIPESKYVSKILKDLYICCRSDDIINYIYVHDENDLIFINQKNIIKNQETLIIKPNKIKINPNSIQYDINNVRCNIKEILPNAKILETEYLNFISRIQLTCSATRCDTYYATINSKFENTGDELYFIKGPFLNEINIQNYITIQKYKEKLNIPFIEAKCIYLIPDRWPEGVALGIRNTINEKLKNKEPYPFMICKSIINKENIVFRMHSSKLWPDTNVIDPTKTQLHLKSPCLIEDQLLIDYYNALAIRIKFGTGDIADRNFLQYSDRLYSIDEEVISDTPLTKENILNELKIKKFTYLQEQLPHYKDKLIPELYAHLHDIFINYKL